jgi:hypothetical protein
MPWRHRGGSRWITLNLSLTSALDGGGSGQRHVPAALRLGRTRHSLYKILGGPQGRSRRVRNISPPPWFVPPNYPNLSEYLYRLLYPGPPQNCSWYVSVRIVFSVKSYRSETDFFLSAEDKVWMYLKRWVCQNEKFAVPGLASEGVSRASNLRTDTYAIAETVVLY